MAEIKKILGGLSLITEQKALTDLDGKLNASKLLMKVDDNSVKEISFPDFKKYTNTPFNTVNVTSTADTITLTNTTELVRGLGLTSENINIQPIANIANMSDRQEVVFQLESAAANGTTLNFDSGSFQWINNNAARTFIPSGAFYQLRGTYLPAIEKIILETPIIEGEELAAGEVVQIETVTSSLNPIALTINKATTIFEIPSLESNVNLSIATGTKSKKVTIQCTGGAASKTLTITDGVNVSPPNKFFNGNIFATDANKMLSIQLVIIVDGSTTSILIAGISIEGKDLWPWASGKVAFFDADFGYPIAGDANGVFPKLNDPRFPFSEWDNMHTVLLASSPARKPMVRFAPGQVVSTVYQLYDVNYDMPVKFIAGGGIKDTISTGKVVTITGNPTWDNSTTATFGIDLESDITLTIYIGEVTNITSLIFQSATSKLTLFGQYAHMITTLNGYGCTFRTTARARIYFDGDVDADTSAPFYFREVTGGFCSVDVKVYIRGKLTVTTGAVSASYSAFVNCNKLQNANIFIQAEEFVYKGAANTGYDTRKAILGIQNTNDANSFIRLKGKVTAGYIHAFCVGYNVGAVNAEMDLDGSVSTCSTYPFNFDQQTGDNVGGKFKVCNGVMVSPTKENLCGTQRTLIFENFQYICTRTANSSDPSNFMRFLANAATKFSNIILKNFDYKSNDGDLSKIVNMVNTTEDVKFFGTIPVEGTAKRGTLTEQTEYDSYRQNRALVDVSNFIPK